MPQFQSPEYVFLNGHASTSSMQPLMNGHGMGHSSTEDSILEDQEGLAVSAPMPLTDRKSLGIDDSTEDFNDDPGIILSFRKKGLWSDRSGLEKFLAGLVVLCLIGFLTVVILLATGPDRVGSPSGSQYGQTGAQISQESSSADGEICTTAGCVQAAANLISAINEDIDPCDDFYSYACGKWNRDNPIPDDMSSFGTFALVRERVRQQMRVLLEKDDSDSTESRARSIKMAKLCYTQCMDDDARASLNSSELMAGLVEMKYWPILHGSLWNESAVDLTWLLGTARRRYGNDVFYSMYVYADAKDTNKNLLYIDQGSLGLGRGSRDYYLNDTLFGTQMDAYKRFIYNVIKLLAQDTNIAIDKKKLTQDIDEMLDFERELAKIIVPEADRRNHTRMYNKVPVKKVAEAFPKMDWMRFFEMVLPEDVRPALTLDTVIIMCEPEFFQKVTALLDKTDIRIVTNYILWRYTQGWAKILDTRFDDIRQKFMRVMTGQIQKAPKWKECVPGPVSWLPLAAGSMYVREHFNTKDKAEALEMIGNLRESFIGLVDELEWMDPKTKVTAVEKAQAMLNHIGYPDFIIDDAKLDNHYKNLTITKDESFFELVRRIMEWTNRKEWRMLTKPFDKQEFEISPAIVNAFYSPEKNGITFPAGILQPPFFKGDYPKSINYGAMGAVIGHEITHGFDDQGCQFDKEGNLNNWWSQTAMKGFQNRTKCIIAQYSSYEVPNTNGLKVNGILTQGENIADNGGVKEAYNAYQKYVASKGGKEEPRLPGLTHFSNDQLFFLSYAHFWCGHKKPEAAMQQILTDEHSPETFRVIGVLSNLDVFSKAYNCKPGTRLNPPKTANSKCTVW